MKLVMKISEARNIRTIFLREMITFTIIAYEKILENIFKETLLFIIIKRGMGFRSYEI